MQNRKGFTLIELLIVVVIIGILAAIAIPKFASTKEKAYLAAMKSDLRNAATAQEGYFADNQTYLSGAAANHPRRPRPLVALGSFVPSSGVKITFFGTAGTGWSATTTPQRHREDLRHLYRRGRGSAGHGRGRAEVHLIAGSTNEAGR